MRGSTTTASGCAGNRSSGRADPSYFEVRSLDSGEIEVIVRGPSVTRHYVSCRSGCRFKIMDGDRCWHRMGDLGWLEANGRLWFCGRKVERV